MHERTTPPVQFRRTDACGRVRGEQREPCGLPLCRDGRESHGDACGRGLKAGKYVSRVVLRYRGRMPSELTGKRALKHQKRAPDFVLGASGPWRATPNSGALMSEAAGEVNQDSAPASGFCQGNANKASLAGRVFTFPRTVEGILTFPLHVPRGFTRVVGRAEAGSSGQGWRGYRPFISTRTAA